MREQQRRVGLEVRSDLLLVDTLLHVIRHENRDDLRSTRRVADCAHGQARVLGCVGRWAARAYADLDLDA